MSWSFNFTSKTEEPSHVKFVQMYKIVLTSNLKKKILFFAQNRIPRVQMIVNLTLLICFWTYTQSKSKYLYKNKFMNEICKLLFWLLLKSYESIWIQTKLHDLRTMNINYSLFLSSIGWNLRFKILFLKG